MEHRRLTSIILPACLLCFVGYASAISVSFGTSGGPIVPPPPPKPTEQPKPPFREPAPVWEDLTKDVPNPNPYKPTPAPFPRIYPTTTSTTPEPSTSKPLGQKMYTHIQYNVPKPQPQEVNTLPPYPVQSNAQKFVQAYLPKPPAVPEQRQDNSDFALRNSYQVYEKYLDVENKIQPTGVSQLGVKYIPAFGQVYFTPEQYYDPRKFMHLNNGEDETNHNEINSDNSFNGGFKHSSDYDLSYEKDLHRRVSKSLNYETSVPQVPYTYYHRQYFYPMSYNQH